VRRVAALAAVAVLAAAGLAGCSSSADSTAASSSAAASPTPTPTPAPVVWAGSVCVERDNLNAAVSALGRNLSYDITSDRSALEQIDRQLRIQVLSVGNAADGLVAALSDVPVDFQAANDMVVSVTKAKGDAQEAVDAVTTSLDAMVNADSILTGVAEAGKALVAAKAAFQAGQALVGVVSDSATSANTELQAAFDAAPQCQEQPASS
jgi:hypothetical protein